MVRRLRWCHLRRVPQRLLDSTASFPRHSSLQVVPILNVLAIANVLRAISHGRSFDAFLSPSAALTFLLGTALFPTLITSSEGAANSLTVSRATSGEKILKAILVVSARGCCPCWRTRRRPTE